MGEKKERYQNRIELLQGTLDLLILQTLQWGHSMATGSVWPFATNPVNPPGRYGLTLSGAAQAGKAEMDQVGMEDFRKQPAGEILPA